MVKPNFDLHYITDPVYKFRINFFYGGTYNQFLDTIEGSTGYKSERSTGKTMGCFVASPDTNLYFLWLPRSFKLVTLGHEVVHVLYTMFTAVGVPTAIQNQETFAYHWEWWFEQVKSIVKGGKRTR